MEIAIGGETYEYRTDYQEEQPLRESFDALCRQTFDISLETWYLEGFWSDRYHPHTLFQDGRAVANISVSLMDLVVLGRQVHCVQLGTVMTDVAFRGRGLQRALMERVLADWADKCDAVYLFANESVLDFYPKLGFAPVREYRHSLRLDRPVTRARARKGVRRLDLTRTADREMLLDRYGRSNPLSLCTFEQSPGLLMYYGLGSMRECVYYLQECRAVAVAEADGGTLYLHDVFAPPGSSLADIAAALAGPETRRVVLGFTPRDGVTCSVRPLREENSALFFLEGKQDLFEGRQLRLPLLSHT